MRNEIAWLLLWALLMLSQATALRCYNGVGTEEAWSRKWNWTVCEPKAFVVCKKSSGKSLGQFIKRECSYLSLEQYQETTDSYYPHPSCQDLEQQGRTYLICYCKTDFCNASATLSNPSAAIASAALLIMIIYGQT